MVTTRSTAQREDSRHCRELGNAKFCQINRVFRNLWHINKSKFWEHMYDFEELIDVNVRNVHLFLCLFNLFFRAHERGWLISWRPLEGTVWPAFGTISTCRGQAWLLLWGENIPLTAQSYFVAGRHKSRVPDSVANAPKSMFVPLCQGVRPVNGCVLALLCLDSEVQRQG